MVKGSSALASPALPEVERRVAWLAQRRRMITASDVSKILGLSRFGGPMDVWLAKCAPDEVAREESERMGWGLRLQQAILQGYADATGEAIEYADPYTVLSCPQLPVLGATLDARRAFSDRRPVDAKNVGFKAPGLWGAPGSDEVPDEYAIQLHVQMMATGTDRADLAVLFTGNKLETYTVPLDPDIVATILQAVDEFWNDHVQAGVPPPPDGTKGYTKFLQAIAQKRGEMLQAPALGPTAAALKSVRDQIEALEAEQARLENEIKATIGNAAGVEGEWGRATWKATAPGRKTDWQEVAKAHREQLLKLHPDMQPLSDGVIERFTSEKPGVRRFLLTVKENNQ